MTSVKDLFSNPTHFRQRQYEALRAVGIEGLSISAAAKKFNYKKSTLYSLVRDIKSGKQTLFFQSPSEKTGRHTPKYITELVIQYRKSNLSSLDIATKIKKEGYKISMRTCQEAKIGPLFFVFKDK
jgi:transposase